MNLKSTLKKSLSKEFMLNNIDNMCFKTIKCCDFIPLVSTFSNCFTLFKRCVLDNISGGNNVKSRSFSYLKKNLYYFASYS